MRNFLLAIVAIIGFACSGEAQVVTLGGYTSSEVSGISPTTGKYPILYNETLSQFQRWNGTGWENWGEGEGGGGADGVVSNVALSSPNLVFTGSDGGFNGSVNLSAFLDNTDSQQLGLTGNTLSVTNGGSVSLAGYLDNTDAQTLSIATNTLSISGGNGVSLASYLDNTDDQTASEVAFTPYSTIGSTNVQLAIQELLDESGGGTDDQVAAEVPITDAGGYYTGTEVEAMGQEIGADLANKLESVGASDLNNEDFGDFTVSAGVASIDDNTIESSNIVDATIDEADLDASVNASLDLADSAMQNLSEDLTPSLGGTLDTNGEDIQSSLGVVSLNDDVTVTGNLDITGEYRVNGSALSSRYEYQTLSASETFNDADVTNGINKKWSKLSTNDTITLDATITEYGKPFVIEALADSVYIKKGTSTTMYLEGYALGITEDGVTAYTRSPLTVIAESSNIFSVYGNTQNLITESVTNPNPELITGNALGFGAAEANAVVSASGDISNVVVTGAQAVASDATGIDGSYALAVSGPVGGLYERIFFRLNNLTNGEIYEYTLRHRTEVGTSGRYTLTNGDSGIIAANTFTSSSWVEVTGEFTFNNSVTSYIQVSLTGGNSGSAGDTSHYELSIKLKND